MGGVGLMPVGFRAWDAAGALVFDTSTKTGRVIGMLSLAAGAAGSLTVAKAAAEEIVAVLTLTGGFNGHGGSVTVDNMAGTLSYALDSGTGGYLLYGVF